MKKQYIIFIILSLILNSNDSDPEQYEYHKFDIINYKSLIEFTDIESKGLIGENIIHYRLDDDFQNPFIIFHLMELNIDSIISDSKPLEFQRVSTIDSPDFHYKVNVEQNSSSFAVYYSGEATSEYPDRSWGGVHFEDNALYAMGVGFNNNYVSTTRHWLPCYDLPSDKATYDITFVTPENLDVYSIGEDQEPKIKIAGKNVTRWKTEIPTASYLVTFAISNFLKKDYEGSVETYVLYQQDQEKIVEDAFQNISEMNGFFEEKFGEYPFEKIAYVLTKKGAMEHQTLINVDINRMKFYSERDDEYGSVIIHELAHQWFGNSVSPFDFRDAWLNESFATWTEALFKEYKFNKTEYWKQIREFGNSLFSNTTPNVEIPIYDFDREQYSNYPYHIIYLKGAVVVSALREKIGDEVFDSAIKDHLGNFKYSNANLNDMLKSLEEASEIDLDPFFDQWIKEPGWPLIRYFIEQENEKYYLNLSQVQNEFFDLSEFDELKFYITYENENGQIQNQALFLEKGPNRIELPDDYAGSEITINEFDDHFALARFIDVTGVENNFSEKFDFIQSSNEISLKCETKNNYEVSIYSVLGSTLFKDQFRNSIKIPVDTLAAGNYILLVKDESNHYIKKFSK